MYNATTKALSILLRDKRVFVACHTPEKSAPSVDFSTGEQAKVKRISFTDGAMLSSSEVKSFAKEHIITGTNIAYLLLERPRVDIDLATRIVVHGTTYNVKKVFDSFYTKWNLLVLERSTSEQAMSQEALSFHASDRTRAYLDWLVNEVNILYAAGRPADLLLWPLAGFDLAESLKHIYPEGTKTAQTGDIVFKEVGRTSGYTGTGLVDGVAPKKATSYAQTNYDDVLPLIEQFNTFMGRS